MGGCSFTQGTRGLGGQAGKRFGLVGVFALGLDGRGWRGGGGCAALGPGEVQHDEEPDEDQQGELIVKKMGDHGFAPSRA